jgi:hypothetical protein
VFSSRPFPADELLSGASAGMLLRQCEIFESPGHFILKGCNEPMENEPRLESWNFGPEIDGQEAIYFPGQVVILQLVNSECFRI